MQESVSTATLIRNGSLYLLGIGLAVVGALGLLAILELSWVAAAVVFVGGLGIVVAIHERYGGVLP